MKLYIAGPLFTQAERRWNRELAAALRLLDPSLELFLPQDEAVAEDDVPNFSKIFEICLRGIDNADIVVGILDGPDSDSGTCFECGYAYARGKPVVGVRTDLRNSEDRGLNAMLSRACTQVLLFPCLNESIHKLAARIHDGISQLQRLSGP